MRLYPVVLIPRDSVSYSGSHTAWYSFIQWFSYHVTQFHTVVLIPRDVASSSGSYTAWCRVMRWFSYRIHLTDNETFRSSENIPMECGNYSHRRGHPFGPFTRGRPLWSVKLSGEVHEITALAFAALKCSFDSTAYMHVTVHCALSVQLAVTVSAELRHDVSLYGWGCNRTLRTSSGRQCNLATIFTILFMVEGFRSNVHISQHSKMWTCTRVWTVGFLRCQMVPTIR